MKYIGYTIAVFGLYLLCNGLIFAGAIFLFTGGIISGGFTFGGSSLSIVAFLSSLAYGFHYQFSELVIVSCIIAGLLVLKANGKGEWEVELDIFGFFSNSGDNSSGD